MVMFPDWSVAEITRGDVGLCGTWIEVEPDEVLALTRYLVGPGGSTSLMSPDKLLTWTRCGTSVNTTVMFPDRSFAVRTWLDTSRPVMSPESLVISAWAPAREVTVMPPEWSLIVRLPEIRVAVTSPELVPSVIVPARPLAVRVPDPGEIRGGAHAGWVVRYAT